MGYATVPETQEHHLGYCIIYIYICTHVRILLSRPPIQSYEIPTAVKSDEMPALGQLRLWFRCCRRYCQWRRCWMCPVLDFDAYLKLQDSQDVAKEAWQNRMPLINRSDTKPWFLRGLFQLFVRLGGRDYLISTCSLLINMCTLCCKGGFKQRLRPVLTWV